MAPLISMVSANINEISSHILLAVSLDKYRGIYEKSCWILWPVDKEFSDTLVADTLDELNEYMISCLILSNYTILNKQIYQNPLLRNHIQNSAQHSLSTRDFCRWKHSITYTVDEQPWLYVLYFKLFFPFIQMGHYFIEEIKYPLDLPKTRTHSLIQYLIHFVAM